MVEEGESLEFVQFDLVPVVVAWVPQIIEYPINLDHVTDLDVEISILVAEVGVLKNIDAQLL